MAHEMSPQLPSRAERTPLRSATMCLLDNVPTPVLLRSPARPGHCSADSGWMCSSYQRVLWLLWGCFGNCSVSTGVYRLELQRIGNWYCSGIRSIALESIVLASRVSLRKLRYCSESYRIDSSAVLPRELSVDLGIVSFRKP